MCNQKENCYNCHRKCNYHCHRPCYYNYVPSKYQYNFPNYPNYPNSMSSVKTSRTLDTICDGKENFVFEEALPNIGHVSVTVRGDCPAQIWIYYLDSFYVKRLGKLINPGQSHTFDTIDSLLKVSITCNPIRYNCERCNSNSTVDHCIVDYIITG